MARRTSKGRQRNKGARKASEAADTAEWSRGDPSLGDASGRRPAGGRASSAGSEFEDDAALWQAFTRNMDRLHLNGRVPDHDLQTPPKLRNNVEKDDARPPHHGKAPPPSVAAPRSRGVKPTTTVPSAPLPGKIDAKEVRRIAKGQSDIDARIDLHGMRQQEAHSALRVFLFRSVAKGHRMVLVITGKGTAVGGGRSDPDERFGAFVNEGGLGRGVLRRNVPLWLAEPDMRAIVVGYTSAHIRHGGDGALYVRLRRQR